MRCKAAVVDGFGAAVEKKFFRRDVLDSDATILLRALDADVVDHRGRHDAAVWHFNIFAEWAAFLLNDFQVRIGE